MDQGHFARSTRDKDYIHYLPEEVICLEDVFENYPFSYVSLPHFHRIIRAAGANSGLVRRDNVKVKPYGVAWSSTPLDHWVAESMKAFNYHLYDSIRGFTKQPKLGRATYQLLKFASPVHTSKPLHSHIDSTTAYRSALDDLRNLFKGRQFDTLDLKDMFKQLPMNTAAGYPYLKRKSEVVGSCFKNVTHKYQELIRGKKIYQEPCQLALRGHLSPIEQVKTRPVWINSFDHIALENIMVRNVYDFIFSDSDMQNLIMTGPNVLSRLRQYLVDTRTQTYVNLDYSSWDTWHCRFAGRDVFNILWEHIRFREGEHHVAQFVQKQFMDSLIALPDGTVYQKRSGTCSGSLLTALINSLLNFVVLKTCFKFMDVDYSIENLRILGDDVGFSFTSTSPPELFLEKLSMNLQIFFGLRLNPTKCLIVPRHEPCEKRKFIGYSIMNDRLYRDEIEFFKYVLYVERPVEDIGTSFSRVISYLLLGGLHHQQFCRFVESYMGHFEHLLIRQPNVMDQNVFKFGNLRVIKHVFQMSIDELVGDGFELETFRNWDFISLPYRFTLGVTPFNI